MREADAGELFLVHLDDFMCQVSASCSYICNPAGGVKLSGFMSASSIAAPHWTYAAFHIAFENSSGPPSRTPRAPPLCSRAAVQPPMRDAAGRQAWPLPERWQSVIDTRRHAKRRVLLFVSLHLFFTAFFPPIFTCAALSIACFDIAVSKATAIQLQPHNEMSTHLVSLYYCLRVLTLHE